MPLRTWFLAPLPAACAAGSCALPGRAARQSSCRCLPRCLLPSRAARANARRTAACPLLCLLLPPPAVRLCTAACFQVVAWDQLSGSPQSIYLRSIRWRPKTGPNFRLTELFGPLIFVRYFGFQFVKTKFLKDRLPGLIFWSRPNAHPYSFAQRYLALCWNSMGPTIGVHEDTAC